MNISKQSHTNKKLRPQKLKLTREKQLILITLHVYKGSIDYHFKLIKISSRMIHVHKNSLYLIEEMT